MSSAQLAAGTVLDGLTLRAPVRSRAGAVTYDAVDAQGHPASVTVYDPSCFPSALVLERSLREIRQLQSIDHPRIARVLACGKLPNGGTYEVHQPLPSASLTEHLAAGPLATGDAIALGQQIGEALVEAQKAGVIHRNLGADVVFPSPEGVVLTGFAVGAPLGGRSFGALDSIAPEQVEGKVVDQRTLIYNLAALLVFMLRGRPLFDGDVAAVLAEHLNGEVPSDVPHPLPRALAKDPRMRPMMLRQFLGELPGITTTAGAAARPGAAAPPPSSRGWTMFTSAVDTDATEAAAAAASTAAPVAPPAGAPAPPSSRGWTMFTKDDAPAGAAPGPAAAAPTPEAAPAAPTGTVAMPAVAPAPAPAAPPVDPAAPAKPSTRGWTMFTSAADDDAAPASPPPAAAVSPSPPAPPTPASPAPPDTDAPTPSTRGWTMFMTEGGDAVTPPPTPVATASVVHPAAPPPAAAPPSAPPVPAPPATGEAKPSTRGWTMFTKADGEPAAPPAAPAGSATAPAITVPSSPPPAAAAAEPAGVEAGETPPTSRGWTLFMEPGTAAAAAAAATASSSAPPAAPTPVATPDPEAPQPGGSKRGWTMFMETPIAEAKPLPAATPTAPVPQPVEDASSDNRGWTVFGTPSPMPGGAEANAPEAASAGATVPSPAAVSPAGSSSTVAAPHVPARPPSAPQPEAVPDLPSPDAAPPRGKTIIAPGMSAVSGSPGEVTGRTGGVTPMPDTQYFRRGDIPPERPTQRTTEVDVGRPPMRAPNEMHGDALATQNDRSLERRSSGARTAVIVVVGVALVGTAVAAVLYLT
jgi:hypothetical protein